MERLERSHMKEMVKIKPIFRKKMATLIEYIEDGVPYRISVQSSSIVTKDGDSYVSKHLLGQGLPYGVPWSLKLTLNQITPESLEIELHKAGIWTAEDALKNPSTVQSAILSALRITLSDIMRIAKESQK